MAAQNLKSNAIVNLDAFPIVQAAVGEGAAGIMRTINNHVACTTGVTNPSTYRIVRFAPDIKIKHVIITTAALGTSTAADIDIAFSDSTVDGTQPSFTGLANPVVQITGPADKPLHDRPQEYSIMVGACEPWLHAVHEQPWGHV
jgi:hypothetical protein